MKKSAITTVLMSMAVFGLAGCASLVDAAQGAQRADMQRVTAIAVRENLSPDELAISNIQGATFCAGECTATWDATARTGQYACSATWGPNHPSGMTKTVCVKK